MDCEKYLDQMSAALDGELTAEERRELDSHLAVCPECAELFRTLSQNANAARGLDCELPAGLHDRILSNLPAQEAAPKKKVLHWKRWGALAACLVLVAGAVLALPRAASEMADSTAPRESVVAANEPEVKMENAAGQPALPDSYSQLESEAFVCENSVSEPLEWNKARFIRVSYNCIPETASAVVIANPDSLAEYIAQLDTGVLDAEGNPIRCTALDDLPEEYSEEYFADHCLLAVAFAAGSGGHRFDLADDGLTRSTVTISQTQTGMTCDMAGWVLLVELEEMLDDGSTLRVTFAN